MKKIIVLTGLSRSSPSEKYNKGLQVSANIYNNPAFQNVPIPQPLFDQQNQELHDAIADAINGSVGSTALMHAKEDKVFRSLKFLASFAEDVVNESGVDGEALILSLGFVVKKPSLRVVKDFEALSTSNSGEVKLRCRAQGSCTYFWHYSDDAGVTWKEFGVTMLASCIKSGFTPGANYQFKVQVLNKDGKQPFSDAITMIIPF